MVTNQQIAKVGLYLGLFSFAGNYLQYGLTGRPVSLAVSVLITLPYIYLKYQEGKADARETTDVAET